jgi:hypothetical protein
MFDQTYMSPDVLKYFRAPSRQPSFVRLDGVVANAMPRVAHHNVDDRLRQQLRWIEQTIGVVAVELERRIHPSINTADINDSK